MLFLVATNYWHLSSEHKHLLVSDQEAVERKMTNSWLTYVCLSVCQSVSMSLYLSHILHLPTDLPTASSVCLNWQIVFFIVQEDLS